MTNPDENGDYNIGKEFYYSPTDGEVDLAKVEKHFLKPQPVIFDGPKLKRKVISVAMGGFHILVAARDPGEFQAKLYTSGLNSYGQLGHGDPHETGIKYLHKLTLVKALEHEHIKVMAGGEHFSLALSHDGLRLYAFGRGDYGSLGEYKLAAFLSFCVSVCFRCMF